MIWNDEFVWLHVPKCGGSLIETIFKTRYSGRPSIHQDLVDIDVDRKFSWHDSIDDRERRDPTFRAGQRTVVVSIRRLPSWLTSVYNYTRMVTPHLEQVPERLLLGRYLRHDGVELSADDLINYYIPSRLRESNRLQFVRLEYLEMDFRVVFGQFIDVSCVPSSDFARKVNASPSHLSGAIRDRLLEATRELYRLCPAWATIEQIAYGPAA